MEKQHHDKEWSVEEDALTFLNDAALVWRLTMSQQERWPMSGDTAAEFERKISECVWWLVVLADCMDVNLTDSMAEFLSKVEKHLSE